MFKILVTMWRSLGRLLRRAGSIVAVITPLIALQIFVAPSIPEEYYPWDSILGFLIAFSIVLLFVWHLIAEIFLEPEEIESKRFMMGFSLFSSQVIGLLLLGLMDEIGMAATLLYWVTYTVAHVLCWQIIARIYIWSRPPRGE